MNEVLQINIGNCIIVIDKDAHDILATYLHQLKKYFFSQEDNGQEVYSDIENRVAEIFLEQMKSSKHKASINKADVEKMIETMGQLSELGVEDEAYQEKNTHKESTYTSTKKTLCKSVVDRKISGVAAGIAGYFHIDPLWIRLLFVFTTFWAGVGLITYIVLAVVLPTDDQIHQTYKKLYRIGEQRILGGVSTGLAAYFNVPITIVRLIFLAPILLSIFNIHLPFISINGFLSVVVYSILWAVVPLAVKSSDLLRVKGEAINLDNLRTQSFKASKEVYNSLDRAMQSFFHILKIFFKVVAVIFLVPLVVLMMVLIIASYYAFDVADFFIPLSSGVNQALIICAIAIPCIPALTILIWGIFSLCKVKLSPIVPIVMSILFFVAISLVGFWATKISGHFSKNAEFTEEYNLASRFNHYKLDIEPIGDLTGEHSFPIFSDDDEEKEIFHYNDDSLWLGNIAFHIAPTTKADYYFEIKYGANAHTHHKAQQLAKSIAMPFKVQGDTIIIQKANLYTKSKPYHFERVNCTLYIPTGKSVTLLETIPNAGEDLLKNTIYTSEGTYISDAPKP